jgi:hypothetical protein
MATARPLVVCLLAPLLAGAMIFTPSPDRGGHMRSNWDNWGLIDANGTWHLYYIVGGECSGRWVAYGVATSSNGVHWTDHGDMLYASESGVTQSCANPDYALGSGWVWYDPKAKRWLLNFSQSNKRAGPGQSIYFAQADSPTGPWLNITSGPVEPFRPDGKYYLRGGRWDTIRVLPKHPPGTGFFGFITANPLIDPAPGPPTPPPPPPPPPSPPCTIAHDFGCFRELNCSGVVAARCLGEAMIGGSAGTSHASCACACHSRGFMGLGGLEKGACFCSHDVAPDPAKCGAVLRANSSRVCTAGAGGGDCAVSVFSFSCPAGSCAKAPPPPPVPPPPPTRAGFALVESQDGYDWTYLPAPVINFKTQPKVPTTEASGVQPIRGPDGRTRWYALVGAAAWTSIGGRMGMFAYVADNMTGPYEQLSNYEIMACEY